MKIIVESLISPLSATNQKFGVKEFFPVPFFFAFSISRSFAVQKNSTHELKFDLSDSSSNQQQEKKEKERGKKKRLDKIVQRFSSVFGELVVREESGSHTKSYSA